MNGYYNDNYFTRVINSTTLKIVQFGTNGNPKYSEKYNLNSSSLSPCGIIEPQPNEMRYMTNLSNTYGTLSMSTSYNEDTETTWNATAELFINTGDNTRLDPMLFVPICTIDDSGMDNVVKFPSVGEMQELGGDGISLNELYEVGNSYIADNPNWGALAISSDVVVSCDGVCPCYEEDHFPNNGGSSTMSALFITVFIIGNVSLIITILKKRRETGRWTWEREKHSEPTWARLDAGNYEQ